MDVKSAILHGDLEEEIYMQQLEGYIHDPSLVCTLKKSIYGLKQTSRSQYAKMKNFLLSQSFMSFKSDSNVYMTHVNGYILLIFYVLMIFGSSGVPMMILLQQNLLQGKWPQKSWGHFLEGDGSPLESTQV